MAGGKRFKWSIGIVIATLLVFCAACGGNSASPAAGKSASADSSSSSGSSGSSGTKSGSSGGTSASGSGNQQITLRVMDWSDSSKTYREAFDKRFEQEHPNIKVQYTQMTIDQFKNTVLTTLKSDTAPDLFPIPTGMNLATVVADKWFQPLDPYIDDQFKNSFVDGTFTEGTTMLNGKIYVIPESLSLPTTLVFYNKKILQEAGVSLDHLPMTYSEFRAANKKITAAGKGKFYGIIEGGQQVNRWNSVVQDWSSLAGSGINNNMPISLVTHKATYDQRPVEDLFALFQGLKEDGSFHPKTMSISAPEARALFASGQAGFLEQGVWNVGDWQSQNPNLDFGVMPPPVPDGGAKGQMPNYTPGGWMGISATSKHPKEAAMYLKELYTGDYYQAANVKGGAFLSVVKGVNEKNMNSQQLKDYYNIAMKYSKIVPNVVVANPDFAQVFANYKDVHPSAGELLQGVVAGAIKDYKPKLAELSKMTQASWDAAMKAAQAKGAKVSPSDYAFPNWDPSKNYTNADYAALKK